MGKVWAVVRREFVERVRTKWFVISTILGPVFLIGVTVLPVVLAGTAGGASRVVVVDEGSPAFADRLAALLSGGSRFHVTLARSSAEHRAAVLDSLTALVQAKAADGFLSVSAATVESGIVEYHGRNVSSLRDMALLEGAFRQALMVERLTRRGIDPALVREAQGGVAFRTLRITKRGATGESGEATFFLAYIVGFVLYIAIFLYSVNVMRSVLEEKQTRIVEVLVSSLKPFQLMLGKVVGVGSVGLLQFGIWGASAAALFRYRSTLFRLLDVPPEAASAVQFPAVGGGIALLLLGYFLLGYLLYSAMFAVVGAMVNTDSEAQQAQFPVVMLLVTAIIMFPAILNEPGGRLAVGMGLIPFFSPIIMPIRYTASEVPLREVALSLAILTAMTVAVVWVAARIYRVGILMYGKRPSLRELWRWARQS